MSEDKLKSSSARVRRCPTSSCVLILSRPALTGGMALSNRAFPAPISQETGVLTAKIDRKSKKKRTKKGKNRPIRARNRGKARRRMADFRHFSFCVDGQRNCIRNKGITNANLAVPMILHALHYGSGAREFHHIDE